ncbi:CopG family transcriptional regulator [Sporosarcina sp. FA9]|uniref:CopG family transcriptional regulator n=1 Tax=Sporosarcina sp. FA9 TaxID=3413030 RepID=UPI003F65D4F1
MAETEKITINMNVVDLGKIDLLVDQGYYSNRTDFIRSSIRKHLITHATDVEDLVVRKSFTVGVTRYRRRDFELLFTSNEKVDINVVGMLILDEDIDTELAINTIESLQVKGVLKANAEVKKVLTIMYLQ